MTRTSRRRAGALLALTLVLAACSSDDVGSSASTTATPTTSAHATSTTAPATSAHATDEADLVVTTGGPVRGAAGDVRSFKGIPYAAPPVGDLRFRAPAPVEPWTDERDATVKGSDCVQTLPVVLMELGDEDCLFLDVYAPTSTVAGEHGGRGGRGRDDLKPVMVWFHGGGFITGSGSQYDGSALAIEQDVVVVTPNYRLGPLGFLALPELDEGEGNGTWGIQDQQAALRWVRDNASAFGGDPGNVTIFGESAGGMSVCYQLVAPASEGLFHKAIDESGPCQTPLPTLEYAQDYGAGLVEAIGCGGEADVRRCLDGKSGREIFDAVPPDMTFIFGEGIQWIPPVDGVVLPEQPAQALADGASAGIPKIFGANRDEGTLFVAFNWFQPDSGPLPTNDDLPDIALELLRDEQLVAAVLDAYGPVDEVDPVQAIAAVAGDAVLACPAIDAAPIAAEHSDVWLYSFEHDGTSFLLPTGDLELGAFHSAEVPFVFARQLTQAAEPADWTDADRALSDQMMGAWGRFAHTGDPNGGDLPEWPQVGDDRTHIVWDVEEVTIATDLKAEQCDFWLEHDWTKARRS